MPLHRYTRVAIALHWASALGILALIGLGLVMTGTGIAPMTRFQLYQWHKSVGLTVLLLTLARLAWRATHRPPPLPAGMPATERRAAGAAHGLLYFLLMALPLSGWALVSASPYDIPTVLYGRVPWPHLPGFAGLADRAGAEAVLKTLHHRAAWVLIALLLLHVGAALRHHLVLRDATLRRMLPGLAGFLLICQALAPLPGHSAEWTIDPARSRIGFSGVQVGMPFTGRFERFEARVDLDPERPETGRATVLVDLTSARTGDLQRDTSLQQKDWFDAINATQARYETTRIVATGNGAYEAAGTLTIRGRTRPVTLPFRLDLTGNAAHAAGHVDLVRTDFGIGQGPWASGEWVALAVGVDIDLVAVRAP